MDISTLTDSVDEMCRTWTAFQEENDRTTGRNEDALHKMNGRMDQLETAIVGDSDEKDLAALRGEVCGFEVELKAMEVVPLHLFVVRLASRCQVLLDWGTVVEDRFSTQVVERVFVIVVLSIVVGDNRLFQASIIFRFDKPS